MSAPFGEQGLAEPALAGLRVLEVADERGEFCGKLLAGLGAEVIKVEPPGGSPTRQLGPFYKDEPDPERSLFFWHYNQGKRGVTLDLECAEGRALFRRLVERADIVLEAGPPGRLDRLDIGYSSCVTRPSSLVWCAITDFGQDGPWRDLRASDLVHLALGGQMMVSGYPPDEDDTYDTPPIAPQMWQAYHMGGLAALLNILTAVLFAERGGTGQFLDVSIHEACNNQTEIHLSNYLTAGAFRNRRPQFAEARAADGIYMVAMPAMRDRFPVMLDWLDAHGAGEGFRAPEFAEPTYTNTGEGIRHVGALLNGFVGAHDSEWLFHEAQGRGFTWAPIRPPESGPADPHYAGRGNFAPVEYPELGLSLVDAASPWVATETPWVVGRRAPHLGEDNAAVYGEALGLSAAEIVALAAAGVI
jgi:crotonobetainyl-CoA:carnitine CoA-transferase CaiB-like acyl-CoA transferase